MPASKVDNVVTSGLSAVSELEDSDRPASGKTATTGDSDVNTKEALENIIKKALRPKRSSRNTKQVGGGRGNSGCSSRESYTTTHY